MYKQKINNKELVSSIILIVIVFGGVIMNLIPNLSNFNSEESDNNTNQAKLVENPKSSLIGTHTWWNPDWPFRTLITITNGEGVDLKNYGVSIVFPYADAEYVDRVNSTLKDVRIIEYLNSVPYERKYFIFQDNPSVGEATIYFNTNVSASSSEIDTYIYFGNLGVESTAVEDGLGLVKNGDFEYVPAGDDPVGNPGATPYSYDPIGWNWSNNVPDNVIPWGGIEEDSPNDNESIPTQYWQNCLVNLTNVQGQVQLRGDHTYKWGTSESSIVTDFRDLTRTDDEYAGVLYSSPLVVPIVGDGDPLIDKIYLHLWRNIRVFGFDYRSQNNDIDGYFVRIINATGGVSSNPDNHNMLGGYLEIYTGTGKNNRDNNLRNFTTGSFTTTGDTVSNNWLNDPSGAIFDLSNYMGQTISIEVGMFGNEGSANNDQAFGQIDEVYFTYQVSTALNEVQTQKSEITVITRDIDGRIVPNAEVSIVQDNIVIDTQITDDTGEYTFTNMNFGIYNFTINYTFAPGVEQVVFNSTKGNYGTNLSYMYNVTALYETYIFYSDIWTIEFEIIDWNDEPLEYGYIKLFNQKGGNLLKTIQLVNGSSIFRWRNATRYYYEVYFDNDDYTTNNILLNSTYIYRSDYETTDRTFNHVMNVDDFNIGSGSYYNVSERVYTNGSRTEFGYKKLLKANITLSNMNNQIDNVSIYYIDQNNKTVGNLIYENLTYSGEQSDFITLDVRLADNSKLKAEKFDAYGLLIVVQGQNSSTCNGIIEVSTLEASHINNKTALSKMHIRVINVAGGSAPVWPVSVIITNGSNPVTILTTNTDGWATHDPDIYTPFTYLIGYEYNISLKQYGESYLFTVNSTSPPQWMPGGDVSFYNYTLNINSTIILDINLAAAPLDPQTEIEEISSITFVTWGDNVTITINVSFSTDGNPPWNLLADPGTFQCTVKSWTTGEEIIIKPMVPGLGYANYSVTINSTQMPAGDDFEQYWFIITGSISGYDDPPALFIEGKISTKQTTLILVDYDTHLLLSEVSKEFDEVINVTVRYYNETNIPLSGAQITFDWLALPLEYFKEDLVYPGYYYISINTSKALSVGKKLITIRASLTNYSSQEFTSTLDIIERPTKVNGTNSLKFSTEVVWIEDAQNFTYEYTDTLKGNQKVGDLDTAFFTWQELDEFGDVVPGISGTGLLIQNLDKSYSLDFNTALKSVGFYYLYLTLDKENYEARSAFINLEIRLREFDPVVDVLGNNNQISVDQGDDVVFEISLKDESRPLNGDFEALTGATVILNIRNNDYRLDETSTPGIYSYTFKTNAIDTFITSKTFTGKITIQADNFTTQEIILTLTVQMEEIFPSMPTFYFILITASVIGIVGSIVGYRVIQQARIPKHVKKIRKIKGFIKSKKKIPASLTIPTKAEMTAKLFADDWKEIGLSIDETLGIKDLKSKKLPIKDKISKIRGEKE